MAKKKIKTVVEQKIAAGIDELTSVDNYISCVLNNDDFTKLNVLQHCQNDDYYGIFRENEDIKFVSLNKEDAKKDKNPITEKEFYRIVGFRNRKLSSRSGLYQESLFGYYLEAKENQDSGYVRDVLNKAVVFQNNLEYVKSLMKNENFMKEWKKDFGRISPVKVFKESGNLRKINIINERML